MYTPNLSTAVHCISASLPENQAASMLHSGSGLSHFAQFDAVSTSRCKMQLPRSVRAASPCTSVDGDAGSCSTSSSCLKHGSSTSNSTSLSSRSTRRDLLLRSTFLPPLLVLGSDDATTIVNSILSGYGLPTLKPSSGFRPYDEFDDDYFFECKCLNYSSEV